MTHRSRSAGRPKEAAILYVRVSLDRAKHGLQEEIISPETQEDRARAYCQSQGWNVIGTESDIDESGYRQHYSRRAGLMRALDAVKRGEATKIVVFKFSRLSRRLAEFVEICEIVETAGGGIVSITEQIDTSTPAGRLIRNVLASFAQFQSEELSEQISETWITIAKRGERPGGMAPYGTVNKRGLLVPNPETHHVLLAMYQRFRDTGSVRAVWDYLAERRIPPPLAEQWNMNTIRGILTNPAYIGQLEWAGQTYQAKWEPIVPIELWNDVQRMLDSRRTSSLTRHDARMLTGIIHCAECGRPMWTRYVTRSRGGARRQVRVYWCCNPSNYRRGCDIPVVDAEEIEATVWRIITELLRSVRVEDLVARATHERLSGASADVLGRRQSLAAELKRVERDVNLLFDLLGDGIITREEFALRKRVLAERHSAITAELHNLPKESPIPDSDRIHDAVNKATAATTEEDRRRVLFGLDARIQCGAQGVHLLLLGTRVSLKPRRVGNTYHFGEEYHRLDYSGPMLTDKQIEFIRRTYLWADRHKIAQRLGRRYDTITFVARKLRREGALPPVHNSASRRS